MTKLPASTVFGRASPFRYDNCDRDHAKAEHRVCLVLQLQDRVHSGYIRSTSQQAYCMIKESSQQETCFL